MTAAKKDVVAEEELWDGESTGGALYKFDTVGQIVKGLVIGKKSGKTKMGEADFYTVQTAKEEVTFIPTKALGEDLAKYLRQYGGVGKTVVEIEFVEEKPSNYASKFKVFRVRAGAATEARLAVLGIQTFDAESSAGEDEGAPM